MTTTRPSLPVACRSIWVLAWLCVGAWPALGQPDAGTVSSLLARAQGKLPDTTLILVDGRENEMFTRKVTYEPGLDIYDIHLAHLSDKYFLWRVSFGDSPMVENGVFSLYLDTDRNNDTGLKTEDAASPRRGTDLEVSIEQGKGLVRAWVRQTTTLRPDTPTTTTWRANCAIWPGA